MITTLLALALAVSAIDDTPTAQPKAKGTDRPTAAESPLPDGTYVYDWILDGKIVGQTTFSVVTSKPKGPVAAGTPAVTRVASSWSYSARGRQMRSTNETELEPKTLVARAFTGEQQVSVSQQWGGIYKVDASLREGIMTARNEHTGRIRKHDVIAPEEPYFLANQAFEHMVIIAAVANASGEKEKTYELLDPRGDSNTLGTTLTREKKEGDRVRWKLVGFAMKGHYWLDARGILVRYQQGELEIALQKFTPRTARAPKSKPKAEPK
ncbi:MAG: hypothetical protein AAF488_12100 [Planctomycetota bacterium]